ncbi:MAG: BatD family protein [Candidatus Kapabacteria bacterium]|nr:BatD family protein [Candidatus Kapabacteria bacterium]
MNNKIVKYLFLLLLFSSNLYSQNFTASVERNQLTVGETFQVSFSLSNAEGKEFKAPSFKGFSVLSGPNTSQSFQWGTGGSSRTVTYSYILRADMEGKFTIEPASITVDGKRINSNSITITVVKGSESEKQKSSEAGSLEAQANELIRKNLFIKLSLSKQSVYQGESLVATYKLYVTPTLAGQFNISNISYPNLGGFWTQDLIELKNLQYSREVVDGVAYQTAELKKTLLIPQQTGSLNVDAMSVDFVVRLAVQGKKRSRDPFDIFDDPFFRQSYQDFNFKASSSSGTVSVKPLPPNQPVEFRGGVGQMQMKAWLDKTTVRANESTTLKVQISGTGNLKLLEPFNLNLPNDLDVYDPKTVDNVSVSAAGMSGNKTFEYYLVPRHQGEFRIDPIEFAYFDLSKKAYVTLRSEPLVLRAEKGSETGTVPMISGVNKEDVKYLGQDIRHIKLKDFNLRKKDDNFFGSAAFYGLAAAPLVLFFAFIFIQRRNEKLQGNLALLKTRKAVSLAKKRLSLAKKLLTKNMEEQFFEEISRALWGYLSDRLSIPIADLTKDSAAKILNERNVEQEAIDKILNTIEYCEFARFAPSNEKISLADVYKNAEESIVELEGKLR